MSEPEELKGRMHPVYPGEAATKLKMREMIFDRFENIPGDIEAILVEKFVVTVGDYEKLSSLLWRILNRNAPAQCCSRRRPSSAGTASSSCSA